MQKPDRWWVRELAEVVDPISLDPIRTMRHPPFELRAEVDNSHRDSDWFDASVLASYLVSTGNFSAPASLAPPNSGSCLLPARCA